MTVCMEFRLRCFDFPFTSEREDSPAKETVCVYKQ